MSVVASLLCGQLGRTVGLGLAESFAPALTVIESGARGPWHRSQASCYPQLLRHECVRASIPTNFYSARCDSHRTLRQQENSAVRRVPRGRKAVDTSAQWRGAYNWRSWCLRARDQGRWCVCSAVLALAESRRLAGQAAAIKPAMLHGQGESISSHSICCVMHQCRSTHAR